MPLMSVWGVIVCVQKRVNYFGNTAWIAPYAATELPTVLLEAI